ncbi:three-Cys-motif partner protein TcmP [Myxococcus eversor]|uniref:three-Cys-motif partner protein TcmP n=1 Tax=Myxococcus eversor TaxID=2709661 RepID=UPI0013CFD1BE|nr:three-Cys-motif partner protein TcmP [Myxococcus eversor]
MSTKEYEWEPGQTPPTLHVHSVRKHEVLEAYLSRYLKILNSRPHIDTARITLVDGFAGGGLYQHEKTGEITLGSPFIFLQATQKAQIEINLERRKPFKLDAHYIFVDSNPQNLEFLRDALNAREYGALLKEDRINLIRGQFTEHAPKIINFIQNKGRGGRAIFLLDQYGYKDVPFTLLQRILRELPSAEIVLTFAIDALGDFLGDNESSRKIIERLGIKRPLDLNQIAQTRGTSDRRAIIQRLFSSILKEESGAAYYTPFFISSRESNRDYWLIHLSMHLRARDEMASLHWQLKNHFKHNGGAGLDMFGYQPDFDPLITGQAHFPDFNFDNDDREQSIKQLREQLMRIVWQNQAGISFHDLLANTCNSTPASSEIYRAALGSLIEAEELSVSHPDGIRRQKGSSIEKVDLIRPRPKQLMMF